MYSDLPEDVMQNSNDDGMVRGTVRVVAINHQRAWVEAESEAACGGCAVAKGCGTKAISGYFSKRNIPIEIANDFNGSVGDRIEVGLRNSTILKVSAVIYLLPLVGLMTGAITAELLQAGDSLVMILGILGLGCGFYAAKSLYVSQRFANAVTPVFLRKLEPAKQAVRSDRLLSIKAL